MYVITVTHRWECDTCSKKTPEYPTEPELRRRAVELGWAEAGAEVGQHLCPGCIAGIDKVVGKCKVREA